MKKILPLCLAVSLLLFSCDSAPSADSRDMSEYYVFRSSDGFPLSDSVREPVKISPVSGAVTSVCIDPLCPHDSPECPLYGLQSAAVSGNRLYGVWGEITAAKESGERSGHIEIRAYDMESGEMKKLASYEDDVLLLGANNNSVYYAAVLYEEETDGFRYALFRSDDRKTVELRLTRAYRSGEGAVETGDFPSIYAFDGSRILWYAPGETGYEFYATDPDGNTLETFSPSNPAVMNGQYADGFAYYSVLGKKPENMSETETVVRWMNSREIRRSRLDGREESILCENVASWILAGGTVYYTVLEEEPETFDFNDTTETNRLGGKIYAVNTDGSGKRLICSLAYDFDLTNTKTFLGAVTDGGATYLCIAVRDFVPNDFYPSGYEYGLSPDTLIVVADTGEARLVSMKGSEK